MPLTSAEITIELLRLLGSIMHDLSMHIAQMTDYGHMCVPMVRKMNIIVKAVGTCVEDSQAHMHVLLNRSNITGKCKTKF